MTNLGGKQPNLWSSPAPGIQESFAILCLCWEPSPLGSHIWRQEALAVCAVHSITVQLRSLLSLCRQSKLAKCRWGCSSGPGCCVLAVCGVMPCVKRATSFLSHIFTQSTLQIVMNLERNRLPFNSSQEAIFKLKLCLQNIGSLQEFRKLQHMLFNSGLLHPLAGLLSSPLPICDLISLSLNLFGITRRDHASSPASIYYMSPNDWDVWCMIAGASLNLENLTSAKHHHNLKLTLSTCELFIHWFN